MLGAEMLSDRHWLARAAVYALMFAGTWGLSELVLHDRPWTDNLAAALAMVVVTVPITELRLRLRRRRR
jgi:hypothetical protein